MADYAPRQYRANVVGYAEEDGGPRDYRVDVTDVTDVTDTAGSPTEVASLTPDEARTLAMQLVVEAARAERQQAATRAEDKP